MMWKSKTVSCLHVEHSDGSSMYLFDSCPQVIVRVYGGRHDGSLTDASFVSWKYSSKSSMLSHSYGKLIKVTFEVDVGCSELTALETRTWQLPRECCTNVKAI